MTTEASTARKISQLYLEDIAFKVWEEEGWPVEKIDQTEHEYRRFLLAAARFPDAPLAVSRDVDRFWHQHILDTWKYQQDCEDIIGRFLHHYPYSGNMGEVDEKEQAERFRLSQELIQKPEETL